MKRAALISVSDRTNLDKIAAALSGCGLELLATSGTAKYLSQRGIECSSIEEYTGQKEILGGRVKTLHPKIHAGLLAKRDEAEHMRQLEEEGIYAIEAAVVNLYPFEKGLQGEESSELAKMIELIDIGGPTMIRAAAKNFHSVLPLIDPSDYEEIIKLINSSDKKNLGDIVPDGLRRKLAVKVFSWLANYNLQIARYFAKTENETDGFPEIDGVILQKSQSLRYGENPHQRGAYYRPLGGADVAWKQYQGKELSYNNFLDFDAALRILRTFKSSAATVAILKHLNPCGVATAEDYLTALQKAKQSDPRSHFGGILAFNGKVEAELAAAVTEDFAEIVLASEYTNEALEIFSKRKNLRVISVNLDNLSGAETRSVEGGVLVQETDRIISTVEEARVVSKLQPDRQVLRDLQFAWNVCAHVKSNAITIVKDQVLLACGAGQMSRIDSVEVALMKCEVHKHDTSGAVAASDAFFPFPDCLERFAEKGIRAVIAPSGAKRDDEIINSADRLNLILLFTADRHFKH